MKLIVKLYNCFLLALMVSVCVTSIPAFAQQKFVRAQGTGSDRTSALVSARVAAWKSYLSTLQGAKLSNLLANERIFTEDLDSIIVDVAIVDEKCTGPLSSNCTISVKATVNESIVDARLRQQLTASSGGKNASQDDIAFLVLARVADSQTSYETRVTKRAESTVGTAGASVTTDSSGPGRLGTPDGSTDLASVTQSSKTVTGGSQEVKRERIKYVAWQNIDDLQNRVGEALNNSKIGTVPWEDLVSNCGVTDNDPFSKLYAESETGQLPAQIRNDTFKKLKDCQLNKILLASIEVDGYRQDPNTGMWLATGNMNITLFDLSGRFARSVGSANRTFSGRAERFTDAGRNALANAARAASDVVVNQLSLR